MSDSKSPNYVDIIVGQRIRWRRRDLRLTQEKLGELIHVSFQQIQKYEKGTNRISAGRLFDLAAILGVEINYFFEGIEAANSNSSRLMVAEDSDNVMSPQLGNDEMDLVGEFKKIKSKELRRSIIANIKAITASMQDAAEPVEG